MSTANLSAPQHQVLVRILAGDTVQAAADAVGVHRNTVLNWRRSSQTFQNVWESVHYEQAMHWRDQLLPIASLAVDTIRDILADPNTPASIRLRAALAIHKIVSTPPAAQPEGKRTIKVDVSSLMRLGDPISPIAEASAPEDELLKPIAIRPPAAAPLVRPESMHNDAQSPLEAVPAKKDVPAPANAAPKRRLTSAEILLKHDQENGEFGSYIKANRARPCPCKSGKSWGDCCQPGAQAA